MTMDRSPRHLESRIAARWFWKELRRRYYRQYGRPGGKYDIIWFKGEMVGQYAEAYQFFRDRTERQLPILLYDEKFFVWFFTNDRLIVAYSIENPGITKIHWDAPDCPIVDYRPDVRMTAEIAGEYRESPPPPPLCRNSATDQD